VYAPGDTVPMCEDEASRVATAMHDLPATEALA